MNNISEDKIICETCYQIKCKRCDWIASEEDVTLIQQGKLNACPLCGWQPQQPRQ